MSFKIAPCALQGAAQEPGWIYLARCALRIALPLAFGSPVPEQIAVARMGASASASSPSCPLSQAGKGQGPIQMVI